MKDLHLSRYEIQGGVADWEGAEKQIRDAQPGRGKSTTVSVRTGGSKRKAGEAVQDALKEIEGSERKGKSSKKGKKSRN